MSLLVKMMQLDRLQLILKGLSSKSLRFGWYGNCVPWRSGHIEVQIETFIWGCKMPYSADITVDMTVRARDWSLKKGRIHQALLAKHPDGTLAITYYVIEWPANAMWYVNQRWGAYLVKDEGQYGEEGARLVTIEFLKKS